MNEIQWLVKKSEC